MTNLNSAIAFAAWLPTVVILFRAIGPRRAAAIAVLGGFLLLPRATFERAIFETITINKRTVSGVALLLGVLVADPRAFVRGRPRMLDLPMAAFVLLPLVSLAANAFENPLVSIDRVWMNFAEWAVPYLIGRIYYGDRDGPRRLAVAVTVAGLLYIPACAFEMAMGSDYYLLGLLYRIPPHGQMVRRLGGWRPEGFLTNGIELATWMSLSATMAAWAWLHRAWRPRRAPSWVPPMALSLAAIACRGVYGYVILAVGLPTAWLSHALRTRFLIAALALLPPVYIAARMSGAWDGQVLVDLAGRAGKADSVAYRLRAEDAYVKKVMDHNFALGFGGRGSDIYDYWAQSHLWPDGWWIHQFRTGGVVGLIAFLLAMFLVPAGLGLALPAGRTGRDSPGAMAWGLALFVVLHLFDSMQNMAYLTPTPLLGGSLVGLFLARRSIRPELPSVASSLDAGSGPIGARAPLAVTVAVLILIEVLGHLPRAAPPIDLQTAPEGSSPKHSP